MTDLDLPRAQALVSHGSPQDFADLYDVYLAAVYRAICRGRGSTSLLARSIANEIRTRGARTVLDCAAGTGFPALELVADRDVRAAIHCTDGDPMMLRVLERKAAYLGIPLSEMMAPRADLDAGVGVEAMALDWDSLGRVRRAYDYVLCRGNSLAYADTWTGDSDAAPLDRIAGYLANVAAKVRPGGWLHVDAPWEVGLTKQQYLTSSTSGCSIWEQVVVEAKARRWDLVYKFSGGRSVKFRRYSSLVTIDVVQTMLDHLGFVDTKPMTLPAERPNFGVIIARKGGA